MGALMVARRLFGGLAMGVLLGLGTMVAVIRPISVAADDLATVTVRQAEALRRDGIRILDVRRNEEWRETGIVPGSILVTAFDAEGRLNPAFLQSVQQQTDSTQPLMLICRSGNRSAKISTVLQEAGYTRLYNVAGGMRAWQSEGLPVERCASC